ncbi:hypothetical protein HPHPP23_0883 [Helicobacter pylori Hp P-23]|uniref:Uncharacterized protein n=1 Tax=Helicobacter pylori (strain B8) TaxID=693745 RepID=D7FEQ5_HELP3|nr:hypothetical protein HPHPP23_0883 [Helicobacter pylori Hp P-23]EJC16352.1 hypothetical protein HPHPP74_1163 [Helicobacter pylori Hp P-74]CBI66662.1 hypothetical protein predicted by Glimmer/Critica [Helicobacter pylori B8]
MGDGAKRVTIKLIILTLKIKCSYCIQKWLKNGFTFFYYN